MERKRNMTKKILDYIYIAWKCDNVCWINVVEFLLKSFRQVREGDVQCVVLILVCNSKSVSTPVIHQFPWSLYWT